MKRFLSLLFILGGVFFVVPQTQAQVDTGVCKCGSRPSFTSVTASDCCTSCATDSTRGGYPATFSETVANADFETLTCTNLPNCWCGDNGGTCSKVPGRYFRSASECTDACRQQGKVSRHYDATGTYTAASGANMCGNYCWCKKPNPSNAGQSLCENHVTSPLIVSGSRIAIISENECSAVCTHVGGTKVALETTYQPSRDPVTCMPSTAAPAGETPTGGTTQRPSTPAPTVRLFNPMAGASTVVDIVNRFIKILMGLVGAGALLMFIYGGIKWMTAGGDAKNVSEAQTILKNSTLGLLLLIFAYSIVSTFFSVLT